MMFLSVNGLADLQRARAPQFSWARGKGYMSWRNRWLISEGEVDISGYLYTIATASMSFAGLSVLTMILRQMLGGQLTKFDSFVTRTWVQLGFMAAFGSILPPLMMMFGITGAVACKTSSAIMAATLGSWALTFPRRRHAVNPTQLPLQVIVFVVAMDIASLLLVANAFLIPADLVAASYATAVTSILTGAGMLFLFTVVHWYDATIRHEQQTTSDT